MKKVYVHLGLACVLLLTPMLSSAQQVDPGYPTTVAGRVSAMAPTSDGGVWLAGVFSQAGGLPRANLARLDRTGAVLAAAPAPNGEVMAAAATPGGSLIIAGQFTQVNGQARNRLARLSASGALDVAWDPGANGSVRALALMGDGSVVVAGDFTEVGGQPRNRVARILQDGTVSASYNPDVNGSVWSVEKRADGKVVLAGSFTSVSGQAMGRVARLDASGAVDPLFANPAANGTVYDVSIQPDNAILVVGDFSSMGGQAHIRIARIREDGSVDASYAPSLNGAGTFVSVQASGSAIVSGAFSQVSGSPASHLARLLPDGTLDSSWLGSASDSVSSVVERTDGTLLLGGRFTQFANLSRTGLVRSFPSGVVLSPSPSAIISGSDPDNPRWYVPGVRAVAVDAAGRTVVGGTFKTVGAASRENLARFAADGSLDTAFSPSFTGSAQDRLLPAYVSAVLVHPQGLLVAGNFLEVNGAPRPYLAALTNNGVQDTAMFLPSFNSYVHALARQADGKFLVGGSFGGVSGTSRARLIRLLSSGSVDTSFNPPAFDEGVSSLLVDSVGRIVVGGSFTEVAGQPSAPLVRLLPSGALDATFQADLAPHGFNAFVRAIALRADGRLLVGGGFQYGSSGQYGGVAVLNQDGSVHPGFNATIYSGSDPFETAAVMSVAGTSDGGAIVGGVFSSFNGQARLNALKVSASGAIDGSFSLSPDDVVYGVSVTNDGRVMLAGNFSAGIVPSAPPLFVRLASPGSATAMLRYDEGTGRIVWQRDGSAATLGGYAFLESSPDGVSFFPMGAMEVSSGDWTYQANLPLDTLTYLRARSVLTGGATNGSQQPLSALLAAFPQATPIPDRIFADGFDPRG